MRMRMVAPGMKTTCCAAARYENLDCLRYAHEIGCPWDETTCSAAARNGNLDCLRYSRDNNVLEAMT